MNSEFNLLLINKLSKEEGCEYIKKFFIPLDNNNHAFLLNDITQQYRIMDKTTIKDVYFNRMKEYWKFYTEEYKVIRTLTCELNKPTLYGKYLNICPKLKYGYDGEKYDEIFDEDVKAGVNKMLNFIKEVINNNNEEQYNFMIKWISYMIKGNKNKTL